MKQKEGKAGEAGKGADMVKQIGRDIAGWFQIKKKTKYC